MFRFLPSRGLALSLNLQGILFLLLAVLMLSSCERRQPPPNILFILADDQCYNTLRELGNAEVFTPTLDELAKRGTVFTTVYNMGGWHGAICVASRTMFNTGRFLWRARGLETKLDSLAGRGELWSKEMERLGYDTYMTGKWHVNIQPPDIFQQVGSVRGGMPGQVPEMYDRPRDKNDQAWTPWDTAFGGYWEGGRHWSEVVADETVGFLDQAAGSARPFFMYVAFNAPHDPRQSPRDFVDLYPLENISVPLNFLPEYPWQEEMGCGPSLRDEKLAPFPRSEYAVKVHRQEYYAIISHMDQQIGRIMDHLDRTGQADNTYVFFSADHGLSVGQHGLMGKQNMYDHSLRPPMLVVGPGVPAGRRLDMAVYLQDIMPTTIDYAGAKVPEWVDFNSLRPFIDGEKSSSNYPAVYGAYMDLQRMVRMDDYKLIVYPSAGVVRLFDLVNDPEEIHDLSRGDSRSERIISMFSRLEKLQAEMGDTLNLRDFVYLREF